MRNIKSDSVSYVVLIELQYILALIPSIFYNLPKLSYLKNLRTHFLQGKYFSKTSSFCDPDIHFYWTMEAVQSILLPLYLSYQDSVIYAKLLFLESE